MSLRGAHEGDIDKCVIICYYVPVKILLSYITERTAAIIFFILFAVYTTLYGVYITHGLAYTELNIFLLLIFIPILLLDCLKTAVESCFSHSYHESDQDLSLITVVIATKNGSPFLPATLTDLLRRFTPHQVIVASNGSTDNTCALAASYGVRVMDLPGIGKVAAINEALSLVDTPYVMPMDDDTLIGDEILPTGALNDGHGAVAFRVYPIDENWVTTLQAHEYRKSMDIGRSFHSGSATVQTISGAIGLFRTEELRRQITLHTGEFSGEDLQRTLLVHLSSPYGGVVLSNSKILTAAPNTAWQLFKQRVFGWNPGVYANFGLFIKIMVSGHTRLKLRVDAFYGAFLIAGLDLLRLWAFPIIIFYPKIGLMVYVTYVILEAVPYIVLRLKEPLWVILVFPFYGMIEFTTRLAAFAVFVYRRSVVRIDGLAKLDDYRQAKPRARVLGNIIVTCVLIVIFFCGLLFHSAILRTIVHNLAIKMIHNFASCIDHAQTCRNLLG